MELEVEVEVVVVSLVVNEIGYYEEEAKMEVAFRV